MRTISLVVIAISVSNFYSPINALSCYVCRHGTQDFETSSDPGCGSNKVDSQYLQTVNRWNDLRSLDYHYASEITSSMDQIFSATANNDTTSTATGLGLQYQTHQKIVNAEANSSSLIHYGCAKLELLIKSPRRSGTLILRSGVWTLQRDSLNTCSDINAKILIATNPSLLALKPYIQEQTACFCDVNECNSASGLSTMMIPLIINVALFMAHRVIDKFCFYY